MVSEEVILDRKSISCIVRELAQLLEIESYYQFKLRFRKDTNGKETLVIIPHSSPVEIALYPETVILGEQQDATK